MVGNVSDYDEKRRQRGAFRAWRAEAASQLRLRVGAGGGSRLYKDHFVSSLGYTTARCKLWCPDKHTPCPSPTPTSTPPPICTAQVKAQAAATLQEERARIWEEAHALGAQQARVSERYQQARSLCEVLQQCIAHSASNGLAHIAGVLSRLHQLV